MVKSVVKEIGESAYFGGEPVLILFNSTAPAGLREVCVIHTFEDIPEGDLLKIGSKILFGDQEYLVKDMGHLANSSLRKLGHASFYFDFDESESLLPGAVSLTPGKVPQVVEGDEINFVF